MAIKGKKKSQSRGSQAKRRPAQAPRPQGGYQRHVPWYRTSGGRVGVAVGLVLLIGVVGGVIAAVTGEDPVDVGAQNQAQDFTSQVANHLQSTSEAGAAIAAAPTDTEADGFETLAEDATSWSGDFEAAQLTLAQQPQGGDLQTASQLFQESLLLYSAAAKTYALAPDADGKLADSILERAGAQRDLATTIWRDALNLLDRARGEADLAPSGLRSPVEQVPDAGDGDEDDAE